MKRILIVAAIAIGLLATYALAQQGQPARANGDCPIGMGPGMGAGKGMGMGAGAGMRCDGPGPMHAGRGPRGMRGMRGQRGPGGAGIGVILMMSEKLELTGQQKAQLEKMQNDFAMQRIDARAAMEKAQIKMRNLLRDDKASESQVNGAIDELARLRADMQKAQFAHMRQAKGVLNEKQLGILKELRDDRMENRLERRFGFDLDDDDDTPAPTPGGADL